MFRSCFAALFVAACILGAVEGVTRLAFPMLPRFADDFSAPYLMRTVRSVEPHRTNVVVGDSVLWGHGIPASQSAIALLGAAGRPMRNLSFEGGSVVNSYAMLKLLSMTHHEPATVVMNVNVKEFNPGDSAYATLHPALARAVSPYLTADERHVLGLAKPATFDERAEAFVSEHWTFYGMREEIRSICFDAPDAATALAAVVHRATGRAAREELAHRPTADHFLGTYDLTPLHPENVEYAYLRKLVDLARARHIRLVAILTPTNHALLHDYIDTPEYDAQLAAVASVLSRGGARVLNYDRSFREAEFLDNDHLTVAGNRRLATMLLHDLKS